MIRAWRLDDSRQTLVPGSRKGHLAGVVYRGSCLQGDEDLETVYRSHAIDVAGGMLDTNPELSICPEATRIFPGIAGADDS